MRVRGKGLRVRAMGFRASCGGLRLQGLGTNRPRQMIGMGFNRMSFMWLQGSLVPYRGL